MFDLNIRGGDYEKNLILAMQAANYGWKHINFSFSQHDFDDALSFKNDLKNELNDFITIDYTLNIKSDNPNDVRKITRKYRNKASCISVDGGNSKINRACLENVQVDILSKPYFKRYDAGINHVLARQAKDNNVAIEVLFCDILNSYLSHRSKVLANFRDIFALQRKYGFPLVLSSGAESIFDIRTVKDFMAVFTQCGLSSPEVESAFRTSENILDFSSDRKNMILKGVRVVD